MMQGSNFCVKKEVANGNMEYFSEPHSNESTRVNLINNDPQKPRCSFRQLRK